MVSIAIKHPWIISSVHGLSSGLYYQQWNVQEQYLTEFAWAPGSHILTQLYLYYKLHYEKCVISALSCRCGMASMTTIFIGLCEYLMNFFPALISLATLLMFASTLSWKQKTFLQGVTLLESLIVVKCKQTRQKIWISLEDAGEAWHFWTVFVQRSIEPVVQLILGTFVLSKHEWCINLLIKGLPVEYTFLTLSYVTSLCIMLKPWSKTELIFRLAVEDLTKSRMCYCLPI